MGSFTKICVMVIADASGAATHYGLNIPFDKAFVPFPFATFFINVTGSFLIGLLLTLLSEEYEVSEHIRLALVVGFLGAYTTFSTFEFETLALINNRNPTTAIFYVSISIAIGLIGVISGVWVGNRFQ